jgi:ABC-type Fe3+-hydroxamate transport system substrate-binding protein
MKSGLLFSRILFCSIFLVSFQLSVVTVAHAQPPERIISLAPNVTEILFALGLGDRVVGVTNFCDNPAEAKKKQKIGGMSNPSLERVLSLRPDVVILTTDGNPKEFEERLRSLKIRTYVFRARRLSELPQAVRELGLLLDVEERANSLAGSVETAVNRLKAKRQETSVINSPRKKVLFIIWPEPLIVAGAGTAVGDAITLLGGRNLASEARSPYPKYSMEEIIRQSPDVIIIGGGHMNIREFSSKLLKRLRNVPAVRNEKVCYVGDGLYRLGPGVIKGIEEMYECLK